MEKPAKKQMDAVYALSRASRCYRCDRKLLVDEIVKLKSGDMDKEVLCKTCAGLDHLQLLVSGNAQVTRLAKKYSTTQYVVLKWSELWKTYERQGLLLETAAVERAQRESSAK